MHRNVGNLVLGNDLNALSVLEFAVGNLGVTDIIVTGKCSSAFGNGAVLCVRHFFIRKLAVPTISNVRLLHSGHYECGAVRAATQRQDLGLLENWLRQIRDVHRLHQAYLDQFEVRK